MKRSDSSRANLNNGVNVGYNTNNSFNAYNKGNLITLFNY